MLKQIILIITIFLFTLADKTFACDCATTAGFLTVAPKTDLVALVKVKKYLTYKDIDGSKIPMSMQVEVIAVYKGKESRKTLVVWGDTGNLCRPYLSKFKEGKSYVIAFYKGMDGAKGYVHKNEKTSDYSISNCGHYWLDADIKKKTATGTISEKQTEIKLADLKKQLEKK